MTPIDQARRYIDKCDPAISGSGGHNQAFSIACILTNGFALTEPEATQLLEEWNRTCQPPWTSRELSHKIRDAQNAKHDKPKGHMLAKSTSKTAPIKAVTTPRSSVSHRYTASDSTELPSPIPDGTRKMLMAAFLPGEFIRIAQAKFNDEGKEQPDGSGVVLTREAWIDKLNKSDGDPNKFFKTVKKNGIFCSVNPFREGGTKDSDVSAFRHTLLEFDTSSLEDQWSAIISSRVPCAIVVSSGRKSIHAWVKIDAKNREEFDQRVKFLHQHFEANEPDIKNKNPSRFSRLAGCERGESRQELLAIGIGVASFADWQADIETDSIGRVSTVEQIESYKPDDDGNTLIGNRWLCKGGSCLLVGPSGVGKSSLTMQLCVSWAIGHHCFGITPVRPLKILVVQAENDLGDLAEQLHGVRHGLNLTDFEDEQGCDLLRKNLTFVSDDAHTGFAFCEAVRKLAMRYKPDLIVLDPLLSFIGADISKQEVCSQFLRNWLNPIARETGVAWLMIHHTGKPPTDPKQKRSFVSSSYAGLGSSELVNWARATMVLEQQQDLSFHLMLSKRGRRTGAIHPNGDRADCIYLEHASEGIFWVQNDPKIEAENDDENSHENRPKKQSIVDKVIYSNLFGFLNKCTSEGESLRSIGKRLEIWLAEDRRIDVSRCTSQRIIQALVGTGKLTKNKDGNYTKGEAA